MVEHQHSLAQISSNFQRMTATLPKFLQCEICTFHLISCKANFFKEGYLAHLLQIFGYLKRYSFAAIPFGGNYMDSYITDQLKSQRLADWLEFLKGAKFATMEVGTQTKQN